GSPEVRIGLIDGPVAVHRLGLTGEHVHEIAGSAGSLCAKADDAARLHGNFVSGILSAKRGSSAPAICPGCTLLIRPIFAETSSQSAPIPSVTPQGLAAAIIACVKAGARVINLSLALAQPSTKAELVLEQALDYAAAHKVLVVAAAGNQGTLGSSPITRHPWVIPVVAYDLEGRPMNHSNLGGSIGKQGLGAPGDNVTSLGAVGNPVTLAGTSVAAPFVTGAIALLWSMFPMATAAQVKFAVTQTYTPRRSSVVPPLLDGWGAHQSMVTMPWNR
ncbi:MAG: peptidase S8, partial [Planctomycetaceae bacterium]